MNGSHETRETHERGNARDDGRTSPVKPFRFRVFRVFRGDKPGNALAMLAAATVCAIAHYAFGDWTRYPGVVLWRERAFWAGMPAAAVVPMLHWVGWSALSLGRLKAARVILVAGLALGLGDLVWLLVWLNLNAVSGLFKVPLESVTVGYWDFWAWWMPAVVLAGNAVLARRWWRLARTSYARVAANVRACCPSPFPGGRASPRALISFVLCAIWARGDARPPIIALGQHARQSAPSCEQ